MLYLALSVLNLYMTYVALWHGCLTFSNEGPVAIFSSKRQAMVPRTSERGLGEPSPEILAELNLKCAF